MKTLLRPIAILIVAVNLFSWQKSKAQLVGSEVFLQGDFVEVGIATNGAYGTDNDAPTGYHARSPYGPTGNALGFVADPDKDGWTVGSPTYIGDYYLPGSPQEGWDIQYNGTWAKAWRGVSGTSFTGGLTGSCTGYATTATYKTGTWEGTLGSVMKIRSVTKLKNNKVYFLNTVVIKNISSSTIYNIYYDRTVDPDNEAVVVPAPPLDGYTTYNKIKFKIPNTDNKTLVAAEGRSYGSYLGLGSRDCRAKPYILKSGLQPGTNDSLNLLYDSLCNNGIYKLDSLYTSDVGIGVIFKIDSIKAGDSTQLSYAYILREADLDSAFEDLKPEFLIGDKPYISNDTARACAGANLPIDIVNGDYFDWVWSPATGLSTTTGSKVVLTVGSTPITYTATVTNPVCYTPELKITVVPIPPPAPPKVTGPIYYCYLDKASPLTATATGTAKLRWYYTRTGSTPLASITPSTGIVGSQYYYVSQIQDSLCESTRDSILVITRALPKIDSFIHTDLTYCAANDGTITFRTDSANATYTLQYDYNGSPVTTTITSGADRTYTLTGLKGGSYSYFTITNKYGCKSIVFVGPIDVIDPVPPGPPISNNGPKCIGDEGVLNAPIIPGATYKWTGPGGFSSILRNPTFTVAANSAGEYTLVVTVGTCVHTPSKTLFEVSPTPKNQKFFSPYKLCEQSNLIVDIFRENFTTDYVWTGADLAQINQSLSIPNINQSQAGYYVLTATSDNGCIAKDTIQVIVDKKVDFAIIADTTICEVDSATLIVWTNSNNIKWTPNTGLTDSTSASIKARPANTITYTALAMSGNTCPDTSGIVKVVVIPTPKVIGYDTTVRMNVPYTIVPVYGQGVLKWRWTPSDSLSCSDCPNPEFNSNRQMMYRVEGINKEGCVGTGLVNINVFCDGANVTMPNAFTPNGDGNNDIFYVRGSGFTVKTFKIYNRLGELVFSRDNFTPNDPQYGWDGRYNGQEISDAAGFVYMMEIVCYNSQNAPELIKGTVLMIK